MEIQHGKSLRQNNRGARNVIRKTHCCHWLPSRDWEGNIMESVSIGDNFIICMGPIVYKDIPDGMSELWNLDRPVVRNTEGKVFRH